MGPASDIHSAALRGYARDASTYARGRPEYPAELMRWLRDTLNLSGGRRVADVGAGTGKFTRLLAQTGAAVIAVEPVAQMRAAIGASPGICSMAGKAQALPLEDGSLDALVCAQAFHWFASTEVLDEFARVLRPGGHLGLIWNVRDESVDWVAQITRLITPFEGDAPRFYKGDWRKPFPHHAFTELRETSFPHEHVGPPAEVIVDRFMSVSFIASLPSPENAQVRAELQRLIATCPELSRRETVCFPYCTLAFDCTRVGETRPAPGAA